jgi:uncharacterized protein
MSEKLFRPGPKRLLALDGGGIRGLITLGYLDEIETLLRQRYGNPKLVLADYFDLIGGTSTGAIIATLLSLGYSVDDIRVLYLEVGREAFQLKKTWLGALGRVLGARFDEKPLERLLKSHLGERTLATPDLKTGLVIVVKRADTGSVWPMVNWPHKYFDYNKDLKLWELVRASTAAPTYFRPQFVSDVGAGEAALFVDGGVSMHNNPALLLLMVAAFKGFGLNWPIGVDQLLLCSVGTGIALKVSTAKKLNRDRTLTFLPIMVMQFIHDASELNETLLQWLSRSPTARQIDSQIEDLQDDLLTPQPLLTYLRYDVPLRKDSLISLGLNVSDQEVARLQDISDTGNIEQLYRLGQIVSAGIKPAHFPEVFDVAVNASKEGR